MNILHIGNVANVSSILAKAQRAMRHQATVVAINEGGTFLNYAEDWRFFDRPGLLSRAAYRAFLLSLIKQADVVHSHGGFWHRWVARYLKLRGKRFIIHYHGDELRFYARGEGARRCEGFADAVLYSTPDLYAWCKTGTYVPNPVPLATPIWDGKSKDLVIVHANANATTAEVKGTAWIRKAVLEDDPENVFNVVSNLPHFEALAAYRRANLAISDMKIGWYGMFALECMAMGLPVLNLGPKPHFASAPFGAWPVKDVEFLPAEIAKFHEPVFRHSVGSKQRAFVSVHHDPARIAKRLQDIYY